MSIAWRNLLKDKTRLALSIGGLALAMMLILVLNGFLAGMNAQIAAYLDHEPGTLVVAQDGVSNLLGISSQLPADAMSAVKARGGGRVVPILSRFVILELHATKQPAYLVGYDPQQGGGPWRMAAGREPRNDHEVVLDSILAQRHAMAPGDMVEIMDRDFTVSGLSEGTNSWMTSFVFIRKTAAEALFRAPDATSFLLVTPRDSVGPAELRSRLNDLSGIEVTPKQQIIANDLKLFGKVFSAPIQLMVAIAFLIGVLVVGIIIYTATVERQREYGVLKAIGARNRLLYRTVAIQALIAASAGTVLGVGLSFGATQLIMSLRPQFLIILEPGATGLSLAAGLAMALLSALFPAWLVARLAPAEVFRR